jgi:integrase
MILTKTKLETVSVKNAMTFRLYGYAGTERFRLALGTKKVGEAGRNQTWIEQAVAAGPESPLWPTIKETVPRRSFEYFAALVGYKDTPKSETVKPTWAELRAAYAKHLGRPIESGKRAGKLRAASTRARYSETLDTFGRFLTEKGITFLSEITAEIARVQYQDWRIADIRAKGNSRLSADASKLPGGYVLDVAILCGVFKYAVAQDMVVKSPFKYCGKPGEDAENGAMPFSTKELTALVKHADEDLLALLVLLRTGFRRSDAVRLQWKHVGATHISIQAKKNGSKVRVPIQSDLAVALNLERKTRYSGLTPDDYAEDFVLLNPATENRYRTEKKLYERIKKIGIRAGVQRVHPHRFRDTFAKSAFLAGASTDEVAAWLGDKAETVRAHYGFMDEERMAVADNKLLNNGGLIDATQIVAEHTATLSRAKVRTISQVA